MLGQLVTVSALSNAVIFAFKRARFLLHAIVAPSGTSNENNGVFVQRHWHIKAPTANALISLATTNS